MKKYSAIPEIGITNRTWPDTPITQAPRWCAVDLRDGNQALPDPLTLEQKKTYFDILVKIGWHGEEQICMISRNGGKLKTLTTGKAIHSVSNFASDGKNCAMMVGSATTPPEIYVGKLGATTLMTKQVSFENTQWCQEHAVATPKDTWITSKDYPVSSN